MKNKKGRPTIENAAKHNLSLRVRPTELQRITKVIQISGSTQTEVLRSALTEFLDRHAPETEKTLKAS